MEITQEIGSSIADRLRIDYKIPGENPGYLEDQVVKTVDRLGLLDKMKEISKDNKNAVYDGVAALWAIDVLGKGIEDQDSKKVGGAKIENEEERKTFKEKVERKMEEIKNTYHGFDWFDETVTDLVKAATVTNIDSLNHFKNSTLDLPARYIGALDKASQAYQSSTPLSWAKDYEQIEGYLKNERPTDIKMMRLILNGTLSPAVSKLKLAVPEE